MSPPQEPTFNYHSYKGKLRIKIPAIHSIKDKGDEHLFYNKTDAENATKIYSRFKKRFGVGKKIPTTKDLYGRTKNRKITYDKLVEIAETVAISEGYDTHQIKGAVKLLKARESSKKLSDLIEIIPTIRKKNGKHYSPEHLKEMIRQAKKLIEVFDEDLHLSDFVQEDVRLIDDFLDHEKLNYSLEAKAKYKGALSSLFKIAVAKRWLKENPVHNAEERPKGDLIVEYYKVDDVRRILYGANPRMLASYAIGFFAGLRPSECRRINFENIKIKGDNAFLTLNSNQAQKTKTPRPVQLSDAAIRFLLPYQGLRGPVSPLPQTKYPPLSDRSDYDKWRRHHYHGDLVKNKNRIGGAFNKDELIQDGFRHSYGTFQYWKMIYEGYTDKEAEEYVINVLGHKDNSSIEHYINFNPPQVDVLEFWSLEPPKSLIVELEESEYYQTRIAS